MECNFTIAGWREPDTVPQTPDQPSLREDMTQSVLKFLASKLKLSIPKDDIIQSYRLRPKIERRNRLLFFQCDKKWSLIIKENAKLIKDNDQRLSITQQIPDGLIAQRGKIGEELKKIKDQNKGKEQKDKKRYTVKQGQVFIGDEMVEDKVSVPTVMELFPIEEDQIDLDNIQILQAPVMAHSKSQFFGMATHASDLNFVKQIYIRAKQDHAAADHIIMAFVAGDDSGQQDDGEHRAGKRLLKFMLDQNLKDMVVMVARYYGGIHLGAARFDYIIQSARAAVEQLKAGD